MEEVKKLKAKIEKVTAKLAEDKQKLKEICPHKNIKYQPGYIDQDSYLRDYYDGWIECQDCKLYGSEGSKEYKYLLNLYKNKPIKL